MITDKLAEEILKEIKDNAKTNEIIAGRDNPNSVLNLSSGSPCIHSHVIKKFNLILSQPLAAFSPLEIRCCLCRAVISYPAWYYSIHYSVNHIHYFICFDKFSPNKPTTKCYRRNL